MISNKDLSLNFNLRNLENKLKFFSKFTIIGKEIRWHLL